MNRRVNPNERQNVFVTKSELARRHIQRMILSGNMRPGDRITTREVSAALGISETPIREAIQGLAADGWLSVQNHVGAVVQGLRAEQVKEISALRGSICALAIEIAGPNYDDALLALIDENVQASVAALAAGDFDSIGSLNIEFHRLLCDRPDTPYCNKLLNNMLGLMAPQRHGLQASLERVTQAVQEHCTIRDLLHAKDFRGAAELARQHELNTGAVVIRMLNQAAAGNPPTGR